MIFSACNWTQCCYSGVKPENAECDVCQEEC